MFDPRKYQADFPILQRRLHGDKRLVYLDNAATSQKPRQVIEAITEYYQNHNANVHRGVHQLGDESTTIYHQARQEIAEFFGAKPAELVVVRNTTEAINGIAQSWGRSHLTTDDVVLITEMEHHSNLVPWQVVTRDRGARLEFVAVTAEGTVDLADFEQKLNQPRVKAVAFSHVSNALGTLNPLAEMVKLVREADKRRPAGESPTRIIVDGAQAAPHLSINFQALDVDFYVVSAHKMLGPMGIGGLLVRRSLLESLTPYLVGGGMINQVTTQHTTYAEDLEDRFAAGTPDVAGLVGWAAACQYLKAIGMPQLLAHDQDLVRYTLQRLAEFPAITVVGPTTLVEGRTERVGSVAFVYDNVHAHDVGQILDSEGVAVRSGHHCTMPLHTKFGWAATTRISFQLYNTKEDIDALCQALHKVEEVFGR
jgi:cysteine desulfurase/selenocysteine lyase